MSKIVFLTEYDKTIGFGHYMRCRSLYDAFKEKGYSGEFIIHCENPENQITSPAKTVYYNWIDNYNHLPLILDPLSIVIVDSYLAPKKILKKIYEAFQKIVYIGDAQKNFHSSGLVIIGNVFAQAMKLPQNNTVKYLLGPKYIMLRNEFWNIKEKKINNKIQNILISLGGFDVHNLIPSLLNFLIKEFPSFNFDILGTNENIIDSDKIIFHGNVDAPKIVDLLLNCDIVITNGGQTLNEAARIGIPSICIGIAENQKKNIEWWEKKGFIKLAGWYNQPNKIQKNIIKYLDQLTPSDERKQICKLGRSIIDGQGARRCADIVLNFYK